MLDLTSYEGRGRKPRTLVIYNPNVFAIVATENGQTIPGDSCGLVRADDKTLKKRLASGFLLDITLVD